SLDKRFKCQFLTTLGGSDKRLLLWRITEGSELRFRFAAVFRQAGSHGAALLIGFKWHTVFKRLAAAARRLPLPSSRQRQLRDQGGSLACRGPMRCCLVTRLPDRSEEHTSELQSRVDLVC